MKKDNVIKIQNEYTLTTPSEAIISDVLNNLRSYHGDAIFQETLKLFGYHYIAPKQQTKLKRRVVNES